MFMACKVYKVSCCSSSETRKLAEDGHPNISNIRIHIALLRDGSRQQDQRPRVQNPYHPQPTVRPSLARLSCPSEIKVASHPRLSSGTQPYRFNRSHCYGVPFFVRAFESNLSIASLIYCLSVRMYSVSSEDIVSFEFSSFFIKTGSLVMHLHS